MGDSQGDKLEGICRGDKFTHVNEKNLCCHEDVVGCRPCYEQQHGQHGVRW